MSDFLRFIFSLMGAAWFCVCALAQTVPVTFTAVPPAQSGVTWTHDNAQSPQRFMPESIGGGGAFFDFDNDGWLDIYLVNSGPSDFYTPKVAPRSALYRNNHDGTFTDVAAKAGVATPPTFGMGAAAGDFNADGWTDLYVTGYGRAVLYRNNGNGTFADVTQQAGVAAAGWSTSATWFDFDQDGKLDLWVSQYVDYRNQETCVHPHIKRLIYCAPRSLKPLPSYLFRNRGDGTLADVSQSSGIAATPGMAFGAVATDVNGDGLTDLFVANDSRPNNLYINRGNGTFTDVAFEAGVALDEYGHARAGMGVDAADYDGDGRQDLFVTNLSREFYALWRNQSNVNNVNFADASAGELNKATYSLSGWGVKFMDYDNDGDPDLLIANSHPDDLIELQTDDLKYKQPLLMFENRGGAYKNVSRQTGAIFAENFAAHGLAVGDYDNDGDPDALVINNGAAPVLLRNEGGNRNNWLGLQLVATKSNAGAVITWQTGANKFTRQKTGGGSYLASHDLREILGAGPGGKIEHVAIRWPSGAISRVSNPPMNGYLKIVEGAK